MLQNHAFGAQDPASAEKPWTGSLHSTAAMPHRKGSPMPWSYFFVRALFKFVLKIFYGTIVVENAELIPANGHPVYVITARKGLT